MIKVGDKIEEIIKADHEALFALSRGILNLSQYSRTIRVKVEQTTKKSVKIPTIVMALSRYKHRMKGVMPLVRDVEVDGMTVKTPLAEAVFEKTAFTISKLSMLQKNMKIKTDDWFRLSQNSKTIIVICSEQKIDSVIKNMGVKPLLVLKDFTAIGLTVHPRYHNKPNITFSLLHKIAEREIPLAEVFTTRDEMMFIFETKYLPQIVEVFQKD